MSRLKKALCLFLSVVFLFQLLPVTALAADGDASYTNESAQPVDMSDAVAADEIAVLGEDTSLREEFTKQYTLENGAKMAVVYPSAVHYEENGAWQDIDNRLNETTASYTVTAHAGVPTGAVVSEEQGGGITDAAGTASADAALDYSETLDITEPALRNAAGALSVTFPTSLTDTNRIAVTHRGYTLYFRPDGASSSSAVSSAPETPAGANARMTAVHTESSVTYAGVYGGADIRYDLQSNSLKESYILQSLASTSEVYSSTIAAPGLTPKLHEDGSIDFTDENGEIIFYIPPSYLYDADGLIGNVAVELYTLNTGEYAMVCRPDHDWLSDSARSWPVTLDPTIYTMLSTSSFEDCYVKDNSPGRAYPSTINLIVGNAGTSGVCRAYIRINDLPSIGSSDVIVSAKLHYYCEFSSKVSGTVESSIYQVTAPEWVDYNGIYWNGQPACDETALDFKLNNNRRMGYNIFDITRAARGWYAGELNNGLMIKSMDESTYCWYYYYAKENSGNNRYPKLEIFYINTSGLEECWDYTSQSLGRAGTAYVQDFSGNYLLSRTDMGYGGSRMSAAPGFCYSLAARANDIGYGYGWRSNYAQSIEACTVSGTSYYRWTDGDGTEKYFASANGVWKDELGYGYTLTVSDSGYTITDKKSNTMEFSSAGQLAAVKDAYGNAISITSDGSRVTALTDGAGRHYAFAYSDGRLTQLTYTGAGSDAIETVTYAYTAAGDLASVTYHDGESVTYAWDGAHIMTSASDIENADGSRDTLSVSCSSASPARTTALSYNSRNTSVTSLTFAYGDNTTKVTDNLGRYVIYQFNNFGNTTAVYNSAGQALYGRYAQDESASNRANQLLSSSRLQSAYRTGDTSSVTVQIGDTSETISLVDHVNLLSNGDISADISGTWTGTATTGTDGAVNVENAAGETRGGLDTNALHLTGKGMISKRYTQTVTVSGTAGDIFTFGGWAKAATVPLDSASMENRTDYPRRAGIAVTLYNGTTAAGTSYVPVNEDVHYWQFLSGKLTATGDYTSVEYAFVYENNGNEAWFDGAQLFREPFDYVYTYDDDGNLTSVKNPDGTTTTYTYVEGTSDVASITMPGGGQYSYTYNDNHQLTRSITATGLQTDYGYDAYGNSTSVTIRPQNDTGAAIRSDSTYTADGNMLASTTGGDRNTVTYSNDTDRSLVTAVTDAKNAVTSYSYDSMRRQTGVTGADGSSVSSVYADDYLTSLSHSGGDSSTTYNFSYGVAGLSTAVKIGETWTLVSNDYNSGAWTLAQQLYGNGLWWKYDYDAQTDDLLRRYTNLSDSTGTGYAYTYDSRGQISKIEKKSLTLENGTITGETLLTAEYYGYDAMDRLTRIVVTDGTNLISDIVWTYDADQNVTAITTRVNNNGTLRTDTYAYSYDDDHRPTNTTYGSVSESIAYDGYSRVTGKTVQSSGNTVLSTSYAYRDIDAEHTTTQVSSLTSSFGGNTVSHSYTYDANGNILSDGTTTYAYDSLNQLVWEYNTAAGKAWNYAYDLGGNILSKTGYDYADGQTSNPVTISYTYGDAVWRDLLTVYNGEAITYDGIGNPTSYRGWGMSWQGGRQLASMQKDGTTLSFSYNDAGLRTEKTVNGATRRYIWNSSQLMADVGASDAFYFHYSSGGELIGYTYKTADAETECILVKNQQGDVERVISADGTILASYTYDAWGNVLTAEGSLAASNPIRYRGYYFDTETSLYYLQSRYYDPTVGRFINADNYATTYKTSTGANMFAYCMNSPVKGKDDGGDIGWNIVVGAIVGAVVGAATTAIQTYKETGKVDVGQTIVSGVVGAVSGGFAASGLGMITQAAISAGATFLGDVAGQVLKKEEKIDYKKALYNGALAGGLSLVGSALGSVTSAFHSMKGNSLLATGRDKMLTGYARRAVGQSHSKLIAQGRNLVSAGISYIKSGRAISSVTGTLLTWGAYQEYSRE